MSLGHRAESRPGAHRIVASFPLSAAVFRITKTSGPVRSTPTVIPNMTVLRGLTLFLQAVWSRASRHRYEVTHSSS